MKCGMKWENIKVRLSSKFVYPEFFVYFEFNGNKRSIIKDQKVLKYITTFDNDAQQALFKKKLGMCTEPRTLLVWTATGNLSSRIIAYGEIYASLQACIAG